MDKFYLILTVLISVTNAQLVFPGDTSNKNKEIRQPVYVVNQCPANEWLWPIANTEDGWTCDCANRFVIYKPKDACYELYRQGPCPKGEYLIIPKGKQISECVRNPCTNDTMVPFNGKCHQLYKADACASKGGGSLNVNLTSMEIDCLPATAAELHIIMISDKPCPPGSRRNGANGCRVAVG